MTQPTFLDYITAIGSLATPLLVLILTGIGWSIRNRAERARQIEEKLRDDRFNVYFQILEPYIIALTSDATFANDKTLKGRTREQLMNEKLLALEYRRAAFKLTLIGSDNVVKAFNDLMQGFFHPEEHPTGFTQFQLVGRFLLEIRKGVGNEKTSLDEIEMLRWIITDIAEHSEELQRKSR